MCRLLLFHFGGHGVGAARLQAFADHELVEGVDGRPSGLRRLDAKGAQVGTGVAGEALAGLEPGATELTNVNVVSARWVHGHCRSIKVRGQSAAQERWP